MRQLEAFGPPTFLVVPNGIHRLDAPAWKRRYPSITVIAPEGAREKVDNAVHVDATDAAFDDPAVRLVSVPGTDERELALVVRSAGGTNLVLNDIIFDLADRPGLRGWILKALGMTGDEPRMPSVVKMRQVKDPEQLARQLEEWARIPDLRRILVSHGGIIDEAPAGVLQRIAQELTS